VGIGVGVGAWGCSRLVGVDLGCSYSWGTLVGVGLGACSWVAVRTCYCSYPVVDNLYSVAIQQCLQR
jgi:hypothetical protein